MGVLPCSRRNCKNIMSEYYSHEHGYLCMDCYDIGVKQKMPPEDFIHTNAADANYVNHDFVNTYKRTD